GVGEVAEGGLGAVVVLGEAVDPGAQRVGVGGGVVGVVALRVDQVAGGDGVADHHQLVGGGGAQRLVDEGAQVRGAAVDQVVGGHGGDRGAVAQRGQERGEFVLVQYARGQVAGAGAAVGLVVVGEEVLEGGGGVQPVGGVPGQAAGVGDGHDAGEPGVLGVALLVAAPAGVAQRVDDRRPDVASRSGGVLGVEGEHFGGGGRAHPAHQVGVPGAGQADGLGEHGGRAQPGQAAQGLGRGAERADAQAGHGPLVLVEQADLLLGGEP